MSRCFLSFFFFQISYSDFCWRICCFASASSSSTPPLYKLTPGITPHTVALHPDWQQQHKNNEASRIPLASPAAGSLPFLCHIWPPRSPELINKDLRAMFDDAPVLLFPSPPPNALWSPLARVCFYQLATAAPTHQDGSHSESRIKHASSTQSRLLYFPLFSHFPSAICTGPAPHQVRRIFLQ